MRHSKRSKRIQVTRRTVLQSVFCDNLSILYITTRTLAMAPLLLWFRPTKQKNGKDIDMLGWRVIFNIRVRFFCDLFGSKPTEVHTVVHLPGYRRLSCSGFWQANLKTHCSFNLGEWFISLGTFFWGEKKVCPADRMTDRHGLVEQWIWVHVALFLTLFKSPLLRRNRQPIFIHPICQQNRWNNVQSLLQDLRQNHKKLLTVVWKPWNRQVQSNKKNNRKNHQHDVWQKANNTECQKQHRVWQKQKHVLGFLLTPRSPSLKGRGNSASCWLEAIRQSLGLGRFIGSAGDYQFQWLSRICLTSGKLSLWRWNVTAFGFYLKL